MFSKKLQNEKGLCISSIRSDCVGKFGNHVFEIFCNEHSISHNFSSPRTPQQNEVIERKNGSLQEIARTMLLKSGLSKGFWAEAVNTSCYIQNRVFIRLILNKTPYELWKGRKSNISYFHILDSECFILNIKDKLSKFDPKSNLRLFLGYSLFLKLTGCITKEIRLW